MMHQLIKVNIYSVVLSIELITNSINICCYPSKYIYLFKDKYALQKDSLMNEHKASVCHVSSSQFWLSKSD